MLQNKFLILFFLNQNQKIGSILSYLQTDELISSFYFVSSKFYLVYTNFLIKEQKNPQFMLFFKDF